MLKKLLIFLAIVVVGLYLSPFNYLLPGYHTLFFTFSDYSALKSRTFAQRSAILSKTSKKESPFEQKVLSESADTLIRAFDDYFRFWYGTKYDFNGTSQIPGKGKIACGYFVSGVLSDIGFEVNKRKMGMMASEGLIRKMVHKKNIHRFYKIKMEKFLTKVEKFPDGIFLVGLDTHIGFMRKRNGEITFIHASMMGQSCVVSENAAQSRTLARSKVKIVGLLTADKLKALPYWLEKKKFE